MENNNTHTPLVDKLKEARLQMLKGGVTVDNADAFNTLSDAIKQAELYPKIVEALENIVSAQYDKDKTLANLNGAVSNAKQLLTELKD